MLNQNHINSRNNYTKHDIIKMMDFLIDTILVVFGEMVIQQTTYNWNKQNMHHYLSFITILFYLIYDLSAD